MTRLALIEYSPEGHPLVIHDFGLIEEAAYMSQMEQLARCEADWDTVCNLILNALQDAGILEESGFSAIRVRSFLYDAGWIALRFK